jgi:hypothetical protein
MLFRLHFAEKLSRLNSTNELEEMPRPDGNAQCSAPAQGSERAQEILGTKLSATFALPHEMAEVSK